MSHVHQSAEVPYAPEQMFDLVNRVDLYSDFLPWCEQSTVIERSDQKMVAELTVGWKGMHQAFTTCNILRPYKSIEMQLVDGPFKEFKGCWQFRVLTAKVSHIELELVFDWSSRWMRLAFDGIFKQLTSQMLQAFITRAENVYGHAPR